MAMWAIYAAPLIMSNDLRTIRPEFEVSLRVWNPAQVQNHSKASLKKLGFLDKLISNQLFKKFEV